ncbi:MAG TPA: NnrU family protein [Acetobacteraceae bacterium]|nr:NnrU family protein [Acetobacteraceae bacterium]
MAWLTVAALVWIGVHIGIAGSRLRRVLARRLGEMGFRAAFSLLSVLAIGFLVSAYNHAPFVLLWAAPAWLRWVLVGIMLAAFLLFAASILTRNPTLVGEESALRQTPHGMLRVTRHPMLWSFVLWAAVHVLGNGDTASLLFFGAFLVTALAGMPSIDAKMAERDPEGWRGFAAVTSIVPFGAIAGGRTRFVPEEIGWWPVIVGVVLWGLTLWAHPRLIGVSALPMG